LHPWSTPDTLVPNDLANIDNLMNSLGNTTTSLVSISGEDLNSAQSDHLFDTVNSQQARPVALPVNTIKAEPAIMSPNPLIPEK